MRSTTQRLRAAGMVASIAGLILTGTVWAQDGSTTYGDIEATLGSVPTFFKLFPQEGIAGAWAEFKTVQLNPNTALSGKEKELIGLAVAAQIPCSYCIYFYSEAAKANGATDAEIREAVAMSAITRHWSPCSTGCRLIRLVSDRRPTRCCGSRRSG
jgi:AhpD family alkylhydroperoxidase